MKRLLLSVLTVAALSSGSSYSASPLSGSAACQGEIFNPINDANWNNMFPVTVAGIATGGGSNPPLMHMVRIPANVTGHSGDRDRFAHGLHAGESFVR